MERGIKDSMYGMYLPVYVCTLVLLQVLVLLLALMEYFALIFEFRRYLYKYHQVICLQWISLINALLLIVQAIVLIIRISLKRMSWVGWYFEFLCILILHVGTCSLGSPFMGFPLYYLKCILSAITLYCIWPELRYSKVCKIIDNSNWTYSGKTRCRDIKLFKLFLVM
jgi:hypothetical protein